MEAFDFQEPSRQRESRPQSGLGVSPVAARSDIRVIGQSQASARKRSKPDRRATPLNEEASALFARLDQAFAGFTADTAAHISDNPCHGLHVAITQSGRNSCP